MTTPKQQVLTPENNPFKGRFTIRKASDGVWGVCMALYGPPGSGKSTLAAGAADSEDGAPLVFLDMEGGSRAIAHRSDIEVIDVQNWKDVADFTKMAKASSELPWKTVVFDNMSEYLMSLQKQITGDSDTPSQPEWGKITNEFLPFVREWRDLSKLKAVNVIFIAWEDQEQDELRRVTHNLDFTPKIRRVFPGMVDIVGWLSVEDKTQQRVLDFTPSSRSAAKFRRSQTEHALAIPSRLQYGINQVPMSDIISVLRGGKPWPTAKYAGKK